MSAQKRRYYAYTIMLVWGTCLECIEIVDYAQASFFSDLIQTISRLYLDRRSAIFSRVIANSVNVPASALRVASTVLRIPRPWVSSSP